MAWATGLGTKALAVGWLALAMCATDPVDAAEHEGKPGLLGSWEFASSRLDALPLWRDVLRRMDEERGRIGQCDRDINACTSPSMVAWRAKILELQTEPPRYRVEAVNRFVNQLPKRSDAETHHKAARWATPTEFLNQSGNEIDFAVMKFATLREAGLRNDQLRIVMAKDTLSGRPETILAAYIGGEVLILSTQWPNVVRDDHAAAYVPYISVNETTRWAHIPVSKGSQNTKSVGATTGEGSTQ